MNRGEKSERSCRSVPISDLQQYLSSTPSTASPHRHTFPIGFYILPFMLFSRSISLTFTPPLQLLKHPSPRVPVSFSLIRHKLFLSHFRLCVICASFCCCKQRSERSQLTGASLPLVVSVSQNRLNRDTLSYICHSKPSAIFITSQN